jgi:RNA polymerase sigma-70 factor (ECF subfamily)
MPFRRRVGQLSDGGRSADPRADADLVLAAKTDVQAFGALYERYLDDVLKYCYWQLGDWDDAAEATQQAFANAFATIASFEDRGDSFRRWLFAIAHNQASKTGRLRVRRCEEALVAAGDLLDPAPSPEEIAATTDEHRRLRQLLTQLSPASRDVVQLRLAGLTDSEIAQALSMTNGAVRAAKWRAVDQLRRLLGCDLSRPGVRNG